MSTAYAAAMIQDAPDGPGVLTPDDDGKFMMWDGSRRQMVMAAIRMTGQANTILRSGGYRIQDSSDGPGVLAAGDDGKALTWDNGTGRFVMTAITSTLAGATDFGGTPGAGTDGYAIIWDNDAGEFTLGTFEAAGAVATHVGLADPHTQYELESNNTASAILTKLLTVDGAGSGLDADLLDGNSSAAFLLATGATTGATSQAQTFTNGVATGAITAPSSSISFLDSGGTSVLIINATGRTLQLDSDSSNPAMTLRSFGASNAPFFAGRGIGGTLATPAATPNTQRLFVLGGGGHDGTGFVGSSKAQIVMTASEDWTPSAQGCYITFDTTITGGTTRAEKMRIAGNGYMGIGITSPTAVLHVAASTTARASVCVPHGAAPTSPVNGDIWTDTSAMYVRINGVTKTIAFV